MSAPYQAYSWWHKLRDQAMIEMHNRGMTVFEIARETHYCEGWIREIFKHYGVEAVR